MIINLLLLLLPKMIFNSYMTKTWCVGGTHYSGSIYQNAYEKLNPKTKKFVKPNKGTLIICGRKKLQIFTK